MKNIHLIGRGDTPFYRFGRFVLGVVVAGSLRAHAEGAEHVPPGGACLVAVNHKHDVDPILAGVSSPRMLRYFAKVELFEIPVVGWCVAHLGAIPVRRGESDRQALEKALDILKGGEGLLIFPEGTRFGDTVVHPFLPGVGMLAMRTGVPVIPCTVWGSHRLHDGGWKRLPRVEIRFGPPVDLSGLEGRRSAVYAEAAQRIETAVRDLYEGLRDDR